MLLSVFPDALKMVREEHDRILGKDLDGAIPMLQENPSILDSLKYTTAVIQETLRLYPIAMSARQAPDDM